jgi:hypothetical protein
MDKLGTKSNPYLCVNWEMAFSLSRELDRPIYVYVADKDQRAKVFPSGRADIVVYT